MPELLPLTAADCASSTSETTSEKPKKIQNPPPGHRRPNRVYPQNYAVLNRRSQGESERDRSFAMCLKRDQDWVARIVPWCAGKEGSVTWPLYNQARNRP